VKQLLRLARVSRDTFYRDFSRRFSMPVARYIEHLRIEEATRLLLTTDTAITTIALHCGFGDTLRFRRAFARAKHMSPSEWRQRHAGASALCATQGIVPHGSVDRRGGAPAVGRGGKQGGHKARLPG
jgi:AraC-like DNA-binding protein